MDRILRAEEMRAWDRFTMEEIGVPSAVLMERAALSAAELVIRHLNGSGTARGRKALIFAGPGNNGGDGFACARILFLRGFMAEVIETGNIGSMTEETRRQRDICLALGIRVRHFLSVDHSRREPCLSLVRESPLLLQDVHGQLMGVAGMYHDRHPKLISQPYLLPEELLLFLSVICAVIEIESDLSDRHSLRVSSELFYFRYVRVSVCRRVIRMDPHCGIAPRIIIRVLQRLYGGINTVRHVNYIGNIRSLYFRSQFASFLFCILFKIQMCVCVKQHCIS